MAGLFVTFEGGDGAGKSTQVAALANELERRGYDVVISREPGGTELGQAIRELLLHGSDVAPRAEALLFAADRAHHVASKIRPALERGAVVISDRYLDSSVAYQGAARALNPYEVRELSLWATNGLLPRLTVLLDLPVEQGFDRRGGNHDRMESEGEDFQRRVRQSFLALAEAEPQRFLVVDGRLAIADISTHIWAAVQPLLDESQLSKREGASQSASSQSALREEVDLGDSDGMGSSGDSGDSSNLGDASETTGEAAVRETVACEATSFIPKQLIPKQSEQRESEVR